MKHPDEFDIDNAIDYLQKYIDTYKSQQGYKKYTLDTYVDDILYGLGVSISSKHYSFLRGFLLFKAKLQEHMLING